MNRALTLKIIKDNPCKYVERPKRIKFKPEILTPEEIQKICDVLDLKNKYDYIFHIGLRLTLELGIRRGELGGFEWNDINFEENMITIKNNLIYSNGHVYMLSPKTQESYRSIYISDDILELLKKFHIKQSRDKLSAGKFYEKNIFDNKEYDLVMKWSDGKYVHPMYYLNKLKKVLKKANIKKSIRFHDLRHTNATLLLQEGIDLKVIQERLGHKDISTTSNIYSHVNKKMQKTATEKLNNLFGGKPVAK
jgi:integrase